MPTHLNYSPDFLQEVLDRLKAAERQITELKRHRGKAQYEIKLVSDTVAVIVAEGIFQFKIPWDLGGASLIKVEAYVTTVSSSGKPTLQIRNTTTGHDMLTTPLSIDASEFSSLTASVPPVIDVSNAIVKVDDFIYIDVDIAGTGAKGLGIAITFGQ